MTVVTLEAAPSIDALRLAWRARLSEQACRELAAEYLMAAGKHQQFKVTDMALVDAYAEYVHRYKAIDDTNDRTPRKAKRAPKRRNSKYK